LNSMRAKVIKAVLPGSALQNNEVISAIAVVLNLMQSEEVCNGSFFCVIACDDLFSPWLYRRACWLFPLGCTMFGMVPFDVVKVSSAARHSVRCWPAAKRCFTASLETPLMANRNTMSIFFLILRGVLTQ
jgi:hypothetical protein